MGLLIDTDVVIHIRDGNAPVADRLANTSDQVVISLVTMIELHAGLAVDETEREQRREGIKRISEWFTVLKLDEYVVGAYGSMIERLGYSRTRVLDRLIAATAIVHDLTLVTINGTDFRDVPGLKLEVWAAPAQ